MTKQVLASCAVIGLVLLGAAMPAEAEVSADYSLDLLSAYVWRGITFTDGMVFQPSITLAHDNGLSFNVWGNLDIDDVNRLSGEFQEVDLTLSYAIPSEGKASVEIGLIEYLFPNLVALSTREVYVSVGFDVPASPGITLYYDINAVNDYYGTISFEHSHEVGTDMSLDLGVVAGFAGDDFARFNGGGTGGGLFDGTASVGLSYAPDDGWTFSGFIAYVDSLDNKVLVQQPVDVYAGIAISRSFD